MNEYDIQDALHIHCFQQQYCIPNIYLYTWESDFISVTKAGYVHEYEIKTSRSDFKADFKFKTMKHEGLREGCRKPQQWEKYYLDREPEDIPEFIKSKTTLDGNIHVRRPNYFWYVCPKGIISDVPAYAGLIYFDGYFREIKKAPLLHKDKITPHQEHRIINSFRFKYWNLRKEQGFRKSVSDEPYVWGAA